MKKSILITGGDGYIAKSLYNSLHEEYNVTSINRSIVDLSDPQKVNKWFSDKQFDVVIHTAIKGGSRLVQDDSNVLDTNLMMYYNLLEQRNHYNRFVSIGSGAEIYNKQSMYGLSKHVIRSSIVEKDGFYNLRVFGIFDENELDTRFIKSNVTRYLNKEAIVIHQNKQMDFFYMKDFVEVIRYYVNTNSPPKEFDCCYKNHYYLSDIASKINTLNNYSVNISFVNEQKTEDNYIGEYVELGIPMMGIEVGIQTVYEKLLCKK